MHKRWQTFKEMRKKIETIGFILGWFAIITQFILTIQNKQADITETIIRFFSFFTILTNILVALFFTYRIFSYLIKKDVIFNKKGTLTALTTFIVIVGLVYQYTLQGLWEPKGMQLIVDELLHTIIPLYVLIYWIVFSAIEKINFCYVGIWLLYPVLYLLFILIGGSLSNYYPYPFLNIPEIGIGKVLVHCRLILLLILSIMGILAGIKNRMTKNTTT
jgi:hypothetical protein